MAYVGLQLSDKVITSTYPLTGRFRVLTSPRRPRTLHSMIRRLERCFAHCIVFAGVVVICVGVVCTDQILPQLVAHIASLDPDHHVSLHASDDGVDLVLTHDHHSFAENDEAQALALSESEPAHVVHIMTGPATAKQSASLMISNARDLVPYCSTSIVTEWRTFVPPLPLVYSRPPPDEMSILPLHRSTLLLI